MLGMPSKVNDIVTTAGLLGPGESLTLTIENRPAFSRFNFAAMLILTNDTFVALNNIRLPKRSEALLANAYDAGSEVNDELCASIPGPFCMGAGSGVDDSKGFVHIANGIADIGDLDPETFDWRGPVARVVIKCVHSH